MRLDQYAAGAEQEKDVMLGFVIAVIAGFLTPYAEAPIARPLAGALERWITLEPGELRLVAFALMLLAAGLVSALLNSGSAFWLILGGTLGYFAMRIVAAVREVIDNRAR
jgi:hypothetical protein